jgi:hypothetical protein
MSLATAPTEVLWAIRRNLLRGLDRVAEHAAAETLNEIPAGKSSPPVQSGQLTLALLAAVDAVLIFREEHMTITTEIDYTGVAAYEPLPDGTPAYLVDLDGTMCLMGDRSPYDETRVVCDLVNEPVLWVVYALAAAGNRIIFMSGRSEKCRAETEAWLREHYALTYEGLFMRAIGDVRKDWIVKGELFDRHVRGRYDVRGVFDDRNQVVGMWRSIGLTVFQVAPGAF